MTTEALAKALEDAAEAVINRWHSPDWKDVRHTADFINALREALAAYRAVPESLGDACRPGLSAAGEPSASIPIAVDGVPSLPRPAAFVDSLESGEKGWLNAMAWEEDEMRTPLFTAAQMLAFHEQGRQQGRAQAAERAAEICDNMQRGYHETRDAIGDPVMGCVYSHLADGAEVCAAEIRAELGATKGDAG